MQIETNAEIVKRYHNTRMGMGEVMLNTYDTYSYALWALEEKISNAKTDEARWALNKVRVGLKAYVRAYL